MTARRVLPAVSLGCALLVAGCGGDPTPQHVAQQARQASPPAGAQAARAASAAPAQAARVGAAAPSGQQRTTAAAQQPTAPAQQAAPVDLPLAERVLTPADLGDGWLMQQPDDAAADEAKHEYCSGPFASDGARRQRVARNFARDDGLRVQQELNRYATAADAERALQEFVDAYARCSSYEPQPGLRIELAPWAAPAVTAARTGARMTLHPTAQPTIHAALAVYRAGALLMVLSVVAEQPEPTETWHNQVAPTAVRRARLAAEKETR